MKAVQYKCPSCGASIAFNATSQSYECNYCDSKYSQEEIADAHKKNEAFDLSSDKNQEVSVTEDEFSQHSSLYECPSCGAQVITDDVTAATFCYYCHSPVALTGRLSGSYKPSKIIPFKISRETAEDTFLKWCGKKMFVPKDFKSKPNLEKITGIYVPYWMADCNISGSLDAECKKIRKWRTGDIEYTETKEYIVYRKGSMLYNGIPADGSSKADDALLEAIEPYNYDQMENFSMAYLTGYQAEKYDVDKDKVLPRVEKRAINDATREMKSSIENYTTITTKNSEFLIKDIKWDYTLLPVWFLSYIYKGKHYDFALNGQTGKMSGSLPVDKLKLYLTAAALGILVGAIILIGGFL